MDNHAYLLVRFQTGQNNNPLFFEWLNQSNQNFAITNLLLKLFHLKMLTKRKTPYYLLSWSKAVISPNHFSLDITFYIVWMARDQRSGKYVFTSNFQYLKIVKTSLHYCTILNSDMFPWLVNEKLMYDHTCFSIIMFLSFPKKNWLDLLLTISQHIDHIYSSKCPVKKINFHTSVSHKPLSNLIPLPFC